MEQSSKPRSRCFNWISLAILMTAIYVILVSVFMVTLYRLVLTQTSTIQTLEAKTIELSARVQKLELSLTTKKRSEAKTVSETDEVVHGKPSSKQTPSSSLQSRDKRQMGGVPHPIGYKCKKVCKGKKGMRGERGPQGPAGPAGPPGPPGLLMNESIHMVGKGRDIYENHSHRITKWKVQHKSGNIEYDETRGEVKVKIAGYYFIYSQMYYSDGKTPQMAHDTYIRGKKVMTSMESITSNASMEFHTKYHGGVFHLNANDTISVRAPYTKRYNMDPSGSFFGAFLLHP